MRTATTKNANLTWTGHRAHSDVRVTLSPSLHKHLLSEARDLGVSVEWLAASLVADTLEEVSRQGRVVAV